MKSKQVTLDLSEIKETFVIRLGLNQAHLDHLRTLVESGVKLPPLLISENKELVDGRHRLAVYRSLGHTTVKCVVEKFTSASDKITRALECNVGGSLPPTEADITHTMQVLLATSATRRQIIDLISSRVGFPRTLVKDCFRYTHLAD
jgi:ParB-like chromosome segregation protein Spo0J